MTISGYITTGIFSAKKCEITLCNDHFVIKRNKTGETTELPFFEIVLFGHEIFYMNTFKGSKINKMKLRIYNNKGKVVICIWDKKQRPIFEHFVAIIQQKLSTIKKRRYGIEQPTITGGTGQVQLLYINPQYEQSKILKRIWRRTSFWYEPLFFSGMGLLLMVLMNLFAFFCPQGMEVIDNIFLGFGCFINNLFHLSP